MRVPVWILAWFYFWFMRFFSIKCDIIMHLICTKHTNRNRACGYFDINHSEKTAWPTIFWLLLKQPLLLKQTKLKAILVKDYATQPTNFNRNHQFIWNTHNYGQLPNCGLSYPKYKGNYYLIDIDHLTCPTILIVCIIRTKSTWKCSHNLNIWKLNVCCLWNYGCISKICYDRHDYDVTELAVFARWDFSLFKSAQKT